MGHFLQRVARKAAWAPIAVVVLHHVAARAFGHEPYVDPVMHFLGGAAMAFFLYSASWIGRQWLGAPSRLALDLLAFGLTCSVAIAWELGELLSDFFLGSHTQTTAANTLRDLFLGASGAMAFIAASRVFARRPTDQDDDYN